MNVRRTRFLLRSVGLITAIGAPAVMLWAVFTERDVGAEAGRRISKPDPAQNKSAQAALPSLGAWQKVWTKRLQLPLRESAAGENPGSKPPTVQKAPPPNLVLVGTMVEDGYSKAMFSTAPGVLDLKGVGETVGALPGGPEVVAIEPSLVTLRYQGELIVLRLKGADEG